MVGHDRPAIIPDKQPDVILDIDPRLEALHEVKQSNGSTSVILDSKTKTVTTTHVPVSLVPIHLMRLRAIQAAQLLVRPDVYSERILRSPLVALRALVLPCPPMLLPVLVPVEREPAHPDDLAGRSVEPPIDEVEVVPRFVHHELRSNVHCVSLGGGEERKNKRG
jgi:hypothetical protein